MNRPLLIALAALLSGCPNSVLGLYEDARSEALQDPGPPPSGWQPDAVLHLTPDLVDEILEAALEADGELKGKYIIDLPLGKEAILKPDLVVKRLDLASSSRCEECLEVTTVLDGPVKWRIGARRDHVDVQVRAVFDVAFEGKAKRNGTFKIVATPRDIQTLDVELGDVAAIIRPTLEGAFEEQLKAKLLENMEPMDMAEFGNEDLPLRAVRIAPANRGLSVAMLTRSPSPEPIAITPPKTEGGWQLDISMDSLKDLAAAASFEAGAVGYDVVIEPTSLEIGHGDFAMGLRLWRPTGRGWWRDYTVTGTMVLADGEVELTPGEVVEGDKSPGAVFVDPLAALGEGYILRTIEDSIATTLPTSMEAESDGLNTEVTVRTMLGANGVVSIKGDMDVEYVPPKPSASGKSGKGGKGKSRDDEGMSRPD